MVERRSLDTECKLAVAGTLVAGTHCKKALAANIGCMGAESTCLSGRNRAWQVRLNGSE